MKRKASRGKRIKVKHGEGGKLFVNRPSVAGIDLGSLEHYVACPQKIEGEANVKVFGTTTPQLEALSDWLKAEGVESVAMESTGVYWIPLFEILDQRGIEVILADARQIKHVPGRKTDMIDCQWLQLLHSCGLLRGAFRPADGFCRLRSVIRQRETLTGEQADWLRRMQKSLDQMNIRVHRAVSDISGVTGMAIIRAIVGGERDPYTLAGLRNNRCRKSVDQIAEELTGNWREDHLFNLEEALRMYEFILERIQVYDTEIQRILRELSPGDQHEPVPEVTKASKKKMMKARGQEPLRKALYRVCGCDLTSIDGINVTTTEIVLSELGTDLSCFPTEGHFISFLRLSPKLAISGGKPIRKRPKGTATTRVGAALRMSALTLRNSKTALGGYYRRISRRKGAGVAVFATARKLAIHIYRLLRYGVAYVDAGLEAYEQRFQQARLKMAHQIANQFGYKIIKHDELQTTVS